MVPAYVQFHKHPQALGEQIGALALAHPGLDLREISSLEELSKATGTIFNVWELMDLSPKQPKTEPIDT